jgi:phosphonate transport system substrate-binding protein
MKSRVWIALALALMLVLAACGDSTTDTTEEPTATPTTEAPEPTPTTAAPEPDPTTTTTEAMVTVGSADNPIQVLFVPSVSTATITSGGEVMADALKEATGLEYEVVVPTSYAATIESMCAAPERSMGFIPGLGYVLANELCDVDVSFAAVRFGWDVYWAQIVVPRDSDVETLADLDGATWAYPDAGSTSGYLAILPMLEAAGVTPGETVEAGGHTGSIRAVYQGDADFSSSFFSPPLLPEGRWDTSMAPDIPDDLVPDCAVNDENRLFCGDYRVLDARANLREEAPDVIQKLRILEISPAIPNDTLSFGPDFPAELRAEIEAALVAFAETDAWAESIGNADFYDWTGLAPTNDANYDVVRAMVEAAGITLENIGE